MDIPLTAKDNLTVPFRIPCEGEEDTKIVHVEVRVPTYYERDRYGSALMRAGFNNYSDAQLRALIRSGLAVLYDAVKFHEYSGLLEELWSHKDAVKRCNAERLKLFEELSKIEPPLSDEDIAARINEIHPDEVMEEKSRLRIQAIEHDIGSRYEPLAGLFADVHDQDAIRAWCNIETYVVGWQGLDQAMVLSADTKSINRNDAEYLRSQLGAENWYALSDFITSMCTIDGDEEKNLLSLLASMKTHLGLTESSEIASGENGSLTVIPTIEIQGEESPIITGLSSDSSHAASTIMEA
jgi:hypothetical protein